jgi:hypothetical protein
MRAGIIQETRPKTSAARDVLQGVRTFADLLRRLRQSSGQGAQEAARGASACWRGIHSVSRRDARSKRAYVTAA